MTLPGCHERVTSGSTATGLKKVLPLRIGVYFIGIRSLFSFILLIYNIICIGAGYTGYCVDGSVFSILSYKQMKTKIFLIECGHLCRHFTSLFYYNTCIKTTYKVTLHN